jgi:DNA-binding PadR family transcriptional regulator
MAHGETLEESIGDPDHGRFSDPSLLIMSSLAEGPKHGYAMTKDIQQFAGITLGPGTLYGALARLERQGRIEALSGRGRRRPYRLSDRGAADLDAQLKSLQQVAALGLRRLREEQA